MPDKPSEAATEAVAAAFHLSRSLKKQERRAKGAGKILAAIRARVARE